jgi:glutathione reductase (NADPH)
MNISRSAFIIGAGTAGTKIARDLAAAGMKVTIADSGEPGGTCLWRGCVPKKALYQIAMTYREIENARRFGVVADQPSLDWDAVMAWKWHAQRTYAGDQRGLLASLGIELVAGLPRFVSPDELRLDGRVYRPGHIVIATGSKPAKPEIPGIELADTNEEALTYAERPGSLAILGGGYIAMEFAAIYAAFGTAVTVIVRGRRLLERFDQEAVAVARHSLERLGVRFVTGTTVTSLKGRSGRLKVELQDDAGRRFTLSAERVLAATGRRPALDGLGLDNAGLKLDQDGVPELDAALRTSNPRVWLAGDAAGGEQHTPVANLEGERVARSILSGSPQAIDLTSMPIACFSEPEIAQVGMTEAQARTAAVPHMVARGNFEYNAQAIIADQRTGLVKVIASHDGRVMGAAIAGPHASDLIYGMTLAVRAGMTLEQLRATRTVHPSLSEALNLATFGVAEAALPAAA